MSDPKTAELFAFFNEIGIIEQLARALLEARLPDGLIAPHFTVLNHLTRLGDGRAPIDMARAFQVPKTTMTHTLAGLESRGLVEMRPNPDDGRSKRVWLTPAGRAFRDETIQRLGARFAEFGAAFPSHKIADLVGRLAEIRKWLDEERD